MGFARQEGYDTKLVPVKNLLYALSYAPAHNETIYYFLLVDGEKEEAFRAALAGTDPFNLKDYATIIASGSGEAPEGLKEQLLHKYNAIL